MITICGRINLDTRLDSGTICLSQAGKLETQQTKGLTMPTIKQLAHEMSRSFEGRERNNGDKFRCLKDGHPEWMKDVCFKAHSDMMPDDYRYEFIEQAVDAIADADSVEDARDGLEADVYTSELTAWLHSRVGRTGYVDDAVEEYGCDLKSIVDALMIGQLREKQEVFDLVVSALEDLASDNDEEEEDTKGDEE